MNPKWILNGCEKKCESKSVATCDDKLDAKYNNVSYRKIDSIEFYCTFRHFQLMHEF